MTSFDVLMLNSEVYTEEYFNQDDVCRLCWSKNADIQIITGFSITEDQLAGKIQYCLGIKITEDSYPKKACEVCFDNIEKFANFKKFCHDTDKSLRERLDFKLPKSVETTADIQYQDVPDQDVLDQDIESQDFQGQDFLDQDFQGQDFQYHALLDQDIQSQDLIEQDNQSQDIQIQDIPIQDIQVQDIHVQDIQVIEIQVIQGPEDPDQDIQVEDIEKHVDYSTDFTKSDSLDSFLQHSNDTNNSNIIEQPKKSFTKKKCKNMQHCDVVNNLHITEHTKKVFTKKKCKGMQRSGVINNLDIVDPTNKVLTKKRKNYDNLQQFAAVNKSNIIEQTNKVLMKGKNQYKNSQRSDEVNKSDVAEKTNKIVKKKRNKIKGTPTYCYICRFDFNNIDTLTVHNSVTHGVESNGEYTCFGCEKRFKSRRARMTHEINFCKGLKDGYKCSICERYLPKRRILEAHMRDHRDNAVVKLREYLFECDKCTKKFKTRDELKNHKAVHDGKKNFVCESCGRVFTRQDYLHKHTLIHLGVKRHVCPHCGFRTTQRSSLTLHIRKHTGERPYSCDVCPQRCISSSNLRTHRRLHLGLKNYECIICLKKFGYKVSLDEHVATAHECTQSHTCRHCGAAYSRLRGLRRHLLTKHPAGGDQTGKEKEVYIRILKEGEELP